MSDKSEELYNESVKWMELSEDPGIPIDTYVATTHYSDKCIKKNKFSKDRPIMADTLSGVAVSLEDMEILKQNLVVERVDERLHVTAIAVDKNPDNNAIKSVKAYGDPLGGYAYDTGEDAFILSCSAHVGIGTVPIVLRMTVTGYGGGKQLIPVPKPLLFKYMTPGQRRLLRLFTEKHAECEVILLQSLSRE